MPIPVLMPALSPTMEEGTLSRWHVKEGDSVSPGDVIAEIETDKASMEVEAVEEGRVGRLLVGPGTEGVKVNTPIALLLEEGEDAAALDAAPGKADASRPAAAPPARPGAGTSRADP
ncbi:MAG: biotin/lipoyl-binding protein, partial [Alphaproteobacteria bacterium]|nr:biotin/lipoyl-binding protein [Alphaproteobacteria bacterium]